MYRLLFTRAASSLKGSIGVAVATCLLTETYKERRAPFPVVANASCCPRASFFNDGNSPTSYEAPGKLISTTVMTPNKSELEIFLSSVKVRGNQFEKKCACNKLLENAFTPESQAHLLAILQFLKQQQLLTLELLNELAEITQTLIVPDDEGFIMFLSFNYEFEELRKNLAIQQQLIAQGLREKPLDTEEILARAKKVSPAGDGLKEENKRLLKEHSVIKTTLIKITIPANTSLIGYCQGWLGLVNFMIRNRGAGGSVLTISKETYQQLTKATTATDIDKEIEIEIEGEAYSRYWGATAAKAKEKAMRALGLRFYENGATFKAAAAMRAPYSPRVVKKVILAGDVSIPEQQVRLKEQFAGFESQVDGGTNIPDVLETLSFTTAEELDTTRISSVSP
jgi:hypothetical protein